MRGIRLVLALVTVACLQAAAHAPAAAESSYEDRVIEASEGPDLSRISSTKYLVRITKTPVANSPTIEGVVSREIVAGRARIEIVERSTTRKAEGGGAYQVVSGAINVVNPLAWMMGVNPIRIAQHGISSQVTQYKSIFVRNTGQSLDGAPKQFRLPADHVILVVYADHLPRDPLSFLVTNPTGRFRFAVQGVATVLTETLPLGTASVVLQIGVEEQPRQEYGVVAVPADLVRSLGQQ